MNDFISFSKQVTREPRGEVGAMRFDAGRLQGAS
jgi:hypothetical protein